jgi:hypothetical protein
MHTNKAIEHILSNYAYAQAKTALTPILQSRRDFNSILLTLESLSQPLMTTPPTRDAAYSLLINPPTSPESHLPDNLQVETVLQLRKTAVQIITLFTEINKNDKDTHKALETIASALWPLYSQHSQTNMIGFDLQEHADYFSELSYDEGRKMAKDLIVEWGINQAGTIQSK